MAKGNSDKIPFFKVISGKQVSKRNSKTFECKQNACLENAEAFEGDWKSYEQTRTRSCLKCKNQKADKSHQGEAKEGPKEVHQKSHSTVKCVNWNDFYNTS